MRRQYNISILRGGFPYETNKRIKSDLSSYIEGQSGHVFICWQYWVSMFISYFTKGRFQTKSKMVGFIQRSADPSQLGRALNKKKSTIFVCLYYLYNHQIWRELWRKNWYLLLLKCFLGESGSEKVRLTAGISTLTPPIIKN